MAKILVVDDEKQVAKVICEFLQMKKFDTIYHTDSRKVLELVKKGSIKVDILITDQNMPLVTGMELAREVKGIFPGVKIILFSGVPISPADWQSAGCDFFFEKPVSLRVLATTIAKFELLEKR